MSDVMIATKVGLNLEASDVSGQNRVRVANVRQGAAVGELVRTLVAKMGLSAKDSQGRDLAYHARHEREGRHLNPSELVGDVLREGDQVTLHPDIQAGGRP